jgi:hypothetical protein
MSEPNRTGWAHGRDRRVFAGTAVVVACLAAVAAMLTAGAEARSAAVPENVSPPTISGTAATGETLTASPGSWTGTPPIAFTWQWLRCDAAGANCADITGETAQTYLVAAGDVGSTLRVRETADGEGDPVSAVSAPTVLVFLVTTPVNTAEPVVSGSPVEGATLTTTTGTWIGPKPITYAYQWVRCGADGGLPDGSNCPSIPGATSSSYVLTGDDIGKRLRAQVTASNAVGTATATANPTDVVQQSTTSGPPRVIVEPSISGTLVVGRILSASLGSWAGVTPLSYEYQWVRCGSDGGLADGSNCTPISGATTSVYTLTVDDVGQRMRIRITASNSLGSQTAASNASAQVAATSSTTPTQQAPLNSLLPAILGSASVGTTLTASVGLWTGTAPLLYSYQWLRCGADGGQSTGSGCSAMSGVTGTQYTLVSTDLGQRLRVQVTARNTLGAATATSSATAQVQAAGSAPAPSPPQTVTLPPGAVRLPDGKYSIPVTSVSEPQRLVAQQIVFTPNPVRSRQRPLELRIRVLDTRGYVVRDALVFARSTPLLTSAPGEQRTARDGWVRLRMTLHADFPLGGGRSVQFFVRVRKPADDLLAGVSSRRLVQVATAGSG